MSLLDRLKLTAKGFCMGIADVIPGVSGGTMALILGIYVQFIQALKSLNLKFVGPLFGWVFTGFKRAKFEALKEALGTIKIGFLAFLGVGIVVAFGIGSKYIPDLLDTYPVQMNAFFFGLILASVWIPYQMMKRRGIGEAAVGIIFIAAAFLLVGLSSDLTKDWGLVEVESSGETIEEIALALPSALTPSQIIAHEANLEALEALAESEGVEPAALAALATSDDPRHTLVNDMVAPAGVIFHIPRPPYWWAFLCGFIAICAMVLPGVSGSFMLLALSSYFFMLNALKGFITGMVHLSPSMSTAVFVGIFMAGALIGLVTFSRILGALFDRWPDFTLAAMTGLMIGSLRKIWPFQVDGANALPESFDTAVIYALVAFVVGFVIVLVLSFLGGKRGEAEPAVE